MSRGPGSASTRAERAAGEQTRRFRPRAEARSDARDARPRASRLGSINTNSPVRVVTRTAGRPSRAETRIDAGEPAPPSSAIDAKNGRTPSRTILVSRIAVTSNARVRPGQQHALVFLERIVARFRRAHRADERIGDARRRNFETRGFGVDANARRPDQRVADAAEDHDDAARG